MLIEFAENDSPVEGLKTNPESLMAMFELIFIFDNFKFDEAIIQDYTQPIFTQFQQKCIKFKLID